MPQNHSYRLLGVTLIPLLWFIGVDLLTLASPLLLPPLGAVSLRLLDLFSSGVVLRDVAATSQRWALGFGCGVISGILCGLLLGMSHRLRSFFEFPLEFMRSMPVTAIFPLFLILFGIGDSSKVAMVFTPVFLLMVVNTTYGVTLSDVTRRRMAVVFGASRLQVFRYIVVWDALPQIFVGLRLAVAQSLIVVVVSEMFIGTELGLGQRVYDAYLTSSVATLYAFLIIIGVIGYVANKVILLAEGRIVFWAGK